MKNGQINAAGGPAVTPCQACAYVTAARRDGRGLENYAAGMEASADLMVFQPFRRAVWAARVAQYFSAWGDAVERLGRRGVRVD